MHDDLDFVVEAIREQRANRAVDQAAGQDFLLGGTAFTLEKATGDAAGCIEFFDVVDGQGEEVLPRFDRLGGHDSGQDHGVVHGDDHGTARLASDLAGLDGQGMLPPLERFLCNVKHVEFLSLHSFNGLRNPSAAQFASLQKTKMPATRGGHCGAPSGSQHYLRRPRRSISAL